MLSQRGRAAANQIDIFPFSIHRKIKTPGNACDISVQKKERQSDNHKLQRRHWRSVNFKHVKAIYKFHSVLK